jgi:hypothetical protein
MPFWKRLIRIFNRGESFKYPHEVRLEFLASVEIFFTIIDNVFLEISDAKMIVNDLVVRDHHESL